MATPAIQSYIDGSSDFEIAEEVSGKFVKYYPHNNQAPQYALFVGDDGRRTRISMRYLKKYGDKALTLDPGDRLTLVKKGFSTNRNHTAWEVKAIPFHIYLAISREKQTLSHQARVRSPI